MKSTLLILCLSVLTVAAHAGGSDVGNSGLQSAGSFVQLDTKAAKTVGKLLQKANLAGNGECWLNLSRSYEPQKDEKKAKV